MRRIDAPVDYEVGGKIQKRKIRLVLDTDYRKLIAVARAAEKLRDDVDHLRESYLSHALDALNAKGGKRK